MAIINYDWKFASIDIDIEAYGNDSDARVFQFQAFEWVENV